MFGSARKKPTIYRLAGICLLISVPYAAQSDETAVRSGANNEDDMTVTVRKREDLLQRVPISVHAFSQSEIDRLGIRQIGDVADFSPSLVFDVGADPTATRIGVRGLLPSRGRQNVAVLIDGVDVGTEAIGAAGGGTLMNARITDFERVEVVKGPQSALFGRSAFAGAIQYVTRDPAKDFESNASFEIGNHGRFDLQGSLSGPVFRDVLGIRINANVWSEDGFHKAQATNSDIGGSEGAGIAFSTKWSPSESVSLKARVDYTSAEYDQQADYLVRGNTGKLNITNDPLLAAIEAMDPGILSSSSTVLFRGRIPDGDDLGAPLLSPDPLSGKAFRGTERDVFRSSLIGSWETGAGTIKSYTAITDVDGLSRQDSDGDALLEGPVGMQTDASRRGSILDFDSDITQFSQELQFSSGWDFPLQLTGGGLYWTEQSTRLARTIGANCGAATSNDEVCDDLPANVVESSAELARRVGITPAATRRTVDHWSVFAMLEWQFTDRIRLTAETRYNNEAEEVVGVSCDLSGVAELVLAGKGVVTNPCEDPLSTSTRSIFGPSTVVRGLQNGAVYGVPGRASTRNDWWTPRLTTEWNLRNDMLLYASASRGVKPAGTATLLAGTWFDVDFDGALDERRFAAEKLWSYEAGAKLLWTESLRTNVSIFFQDYKNKQVLTSILGPSGTTVPVIENAGSAEVWGVEFEVSWWPIENLLLGIGYTWLDAEYTEFRAITDSPSRIIRAGNCTVTTLPDGSGSCDVDLSGNRLEKAPRHAAVGRLEYRMPSALFANPGIEWLLDADLLYQSERFAAQENYRILDEYAVANLRFGLAAEDWRVLLYVDNVFDDDTVKSATTKTGSVDRLDPDYLASPNPVRTSTNVVSADLPDPRTVGIRVSFAF